MQPYNLDEDYRVTVYQGRLEDDVVIAERVTRSNFEMIVPLNIEYTVKAVYIKGDITYISINSTTPKVEYLEDYCETPCYFVKKNKINMRIKYY